MATFEGRVLDHHAGEEHDPRSRAFGVRQAEVPTRSKYWRPPYGLRLDQENTPHCGGHGSVNELLCSPFRVKHFGGQRATPEQVREWAHKYYYLAKDWKLDPWGREEGTSTLAMLKVGQRLGYWEQYRWAFSVDDLAVSLEDGPGLLGVPWLTGMFYPDVDGIIKATGRVEGGHLVCVTGRLVNYRRKGPHYRILQSWGPEHGRYGSVYLPEEDLYKVLIEGRGEYGVPVGRTLGTTA